MLGFVRSFLTSLLTAKKINALRFATRFLFFFLLFGRLIFVASQPFDCIMFSVRLIKIRLKRVFFAFWWIFCAICVVVFIFFVILP